MRSYMLHRVNASVYCLSPLLARHAAEAAHWILRSIVVFALLVIVHVNYGLLSFTAYNLTSL